MKIPFTHSGSHFVTFHWPVTKSDAFAFGEGGLVGIPFGEDVYVGFLFVEPRQTRFQQFHPRQTYYQQTMPRQTRFQQSRPRRTQWRQMLGGRPVKRRAAGQQRLVFKKLRGTYREKPTYRSSNNTHRIGVHSAFGQAMHLRLCDQDKYLGRRNC